jgi:hypothetical protein
MAEQTQVAVVAEWLFLLMVAAQAAVDLLLYDIR